MLREIETAACLHEPCDRSQQRNLLKHDQVDVSLQKGGDDIGTICSDSLKASECDQSRCCGDNDKEKREWAKVSFPLSSNVIECDCAGAQQQHADQRKHASIHVEYGVNQVAGNLTQCQSLGDVFLPADWTIFLSARQVGLAVRASIRHLRRQSFCESPYWSRLCELRHWSNADPSVSGLGGCKYFGGQLIVVAFWCARLSLSRALYAMSAGWSGSPLVNRPTPICAPIATSAALKRSPRT